MCMMTSIIIHMMIVVSMDHLLQSQRGDDRRRKERTMSDSEMGSDEVAPVDYAEVTGVGPQGRYRVRLPVTGVGPQVCLEHQRLTSAKSPKTALTAVFCP